MPYSTLTSEIVSGLLAEHGIDVAAEGIEIELRNDRWLAHLPDGRIAWFAQSDAGRENLIVDRKVLRLVHANCSFAAPRVLFEDSDGDFDIRAIVPGDSDPQRLYAAILKDAESANRVGTDLGHILVALHTHTRDSGFEKLLPSRLTWPEPRSWILERLPDVIHDAELIARASEVLSMYEAVALDERDRTLVHGDFGLHNFAFDSRSLRINGIFDFESAAHSDRHQDFRYLVFDDNANVLEAALAVYEPAVGRRVERNRVRLYNAACALSYLAFRVGHSANEFWCGRNLNEDLTWTRNALQFVRN